MNARAPLGRILLTGFMCAGKTTVARALAARLDCAMLDLDAAIVEREGRSIAQIIDADGEARFRQIESNALRDALESNDARVIALGGGAWTIDENRALVAAHNCVTVWLDAPFELCWQRITASQETRPLARDCGKAQELFEGRRVFYSQATFHVTVSGDDSAADIAQAIISALEQLPPQTQKND
ncbi:MAG TPA: shikimate kinase [Pyrinomonadaceae bacterium]|nr:shikimate kinase [Pyrinomonadaceae bacterium]